MNPDTFAMLRTQARLQLERAGRAPALTPRRTRLRDEPHPPSRRTRSWRRRRSARCRAPIAATCSSTSRATRSTPRRDATVWGIDYLFGWVDVREQYSALWAHSFAEEQRGARDASSTS